MSRKELAALVEVWRKALIPEWRVVLLDEPLEDMEVDGAWAVCRHCEDYLKIKVHFTDELLETQPPSKIEVTVVHELLHALTRPWRQMLETVAFDIGNAKAAPLRRQQDHEEEKLVDRLSYILVAQAHGGEAFGTIEGEPAQDARQ